MTDHREFIGLQMKVKHLEGEVRELKKRNESLGKKVDEVTELNSHIVSKLEELLKLTREALGEKDHDERQTEGEPG